MNWRPAGPDSRLTARAAVASVASLAIVAGCQAAPSGGLTLWNRIPQTLLIQSGRADTIVVPPCTEIFISPFPYERYRVATEDGRLLGLPVVDAEGMVVTINGVLPRGSMTDLPRCGMAPTT